MVTRLGPGVSRVGGEQARPHPVHEAVLIGVGHCVIEPIALGHVGEGEVRGLALEEGDLHRHLAVGHDEGVGAVGLLVHSHGLAEAVGDRHGAHLVPRIGTGVMVTVVPALAAVGFTVTVPFSVSPMVSL